MFRNLTLAQQMFFFVLAVFLILLVFRILVKLKLHFSAIADVDAGDPDGSVQEQEGDQHHDTYHKKAGEKGDLAPFVSQRLFQPQEYAFHRSPHFQ